MNETTVDLTKRRLLLSKIGVRAAFFLFLFFFFGVRYADYLRVVGSFSFVPLAREEYAFVCDLGGVLELFALWTASTFSCPLLGGALLAFLALAIEIVSFWLWRSPCGDSLALFCFSFVPAALTSALFLGTGLNAFESNHGVFFLEPTFGVLFALLWAGALLCVPSRLARFVGVWSAHPVLGAYSFAMFAAFLLALWGRVAKKRGSVRLKRSDFGNAAALLIALCVLTPEPWNVTGHEFVQAGIVEKTTVSLDPLTTLRQNSLLKLLGICFLVGGVSSVVACVPRPFKTKKDKLKKEKRGATSKENHNASKRVDRFFAAYATLVILALALWHASPRDNVFFATVKVANRLADDDWEGMLRAESRVSKPSESLIMARELALYRRGELGERLFERPVVCATENDLNLLVSPYRTFGSGILERWGFFNLAARAATNNFVATRGRSIPATRTLVACAIANGDDALAERYLSRLERSCSTRGRDWSKDIRERVASTPRVLTQDDYISTGIVSPERIVAEGLARRSDFIDSCDADELNVWEARLAFALLDGDFETFSKELEPYWKTSGEKPLPKSFQESALFIERTNRFDVSKFQIDAGIRKSFDDFVKYVDLYNKTRDPSLMEGIKAEYGNSAWYNYLFAGTDEKR